MFGAYWLRIVGACPETYLLTFHCIPVHIIIFSQNYSYTNYLYTIVGGKLPQIWFRKEIIHSLISSSERKGTTIPRIYFIHHKCSDASRTGGQHYMGTISTASTEATPNGPYACDVTSSDT
ncbi:hypothetical protein AVEN_203032-1 [Araneus ventricosus]|uniref:Uncharacterized protein n=1 Tax=Araneus ventricosus TaxID=182803 RepID=A0A4Y2MYZ1_ARAVE|nr:hypothetical protein AVEN_203032-1 [Araneus ventricosus]